MTKEELKVMIDETINSNGVRSITGKALNLALTEIVDAIGTTSGGGDEGLKRNDVNFFDYDGTLLYAYTWEEAKALTELPPLPVHDGLEVREWNYTLEDIKSQGVCWIEITDPIGETLPAYYAGDIVIDGTSYMAYNDCGALNEHCNWGYLFAQEPQVNDDVLMGAVYSEDSSEYEIEALDYLTLAITNVFNTTGKADVGACVYDSDGNLLMTNNTYIIPRGVTELYSNTLDLQYDRNFAKVLSIPATTTYISKEFLNGIYVEHLILPKGIEYGTYYGYAFNPVVTESVHVNGAGLDFKALCGIIIPRVLHIPNNFSSTYWGLKHVYPQVVYLPETIDTLPTLDIGSVLIFDKHRFIPLLEYSYFSGIIVVPDELYDEWILATNWSNMSDRIVKLSETNW